MIALIGTTIERNVTSSRMNAIASTKTNTIGRCDFIVSRKSFDQAVMPPTATSAFCSLPTVAGTTSSRRTSSERFDAASVPLPLIESDTIATVLSGLTVTLEGSESSPVAIAWSCSCLIAVWTSGVVTSLALTTTLAGRLPPGNAASMRSSVWMIGVLRDRPSVPASLNCMPSAGIESATSRPPARTTETTGRAEDAGQDRVPHARLALVLVATLGDVGQAALLEPALLAEVGQHGRQERERPDHGDGDDDDRADAEGREDRVAGEEHAGHRGDHGEAGDQHRATRGGGGDVERGLGRAALVLLLHHATQVEHRVVDADGQADQHRDDLDGLMQRSELADGPEQPGGGHEGRDAEQQRDAGGDGRTEHEQQDDQRADHRDLLRLRLVRTLGGAERLALGRAAVLLDEHLGVRLLDGGDGCERGVGDGLERLLLLLRLVLPGQREGDEHRAAVLRDGVGAVLLVERALDVGDALDLAEAIDDVLDGGGDLRTIGLDRALALDQDALADLVGIVRVVDDDVVALGLAVAHLRRLEVLLADLAADHGGEDDEEDPAENGCLAVRRAPSCRRAPRGSGIALWGVPPRGDREDFWGTCADSQRSRPAPMRASLRPVGGLHPSCGAASHPSWGGWPRILR